MGPNAAAHQDDDPLFVDMINSIGPSVFVRQMARMHEAPKYFQWVMKWLSEIDLHGSFYTKPTEHLLGQGIRLDRGRARCAVGLDRHRGRQDR